MTDRAAFAWVVVGAMLSVGCMAPPSAMELTNSSGLPVECVVDGGPDEGVEAWVGPGVRAVYVGFRGQRAVNFDGVPLPEEPRDGLWLAHEKHGLVVRRGH